MRYLTCAETAKLVRAQLKSEFPGVKFSVRSDSYAGGASIRVAWTDGPKSSRVEAVTGPFEGRRFDGMIDLASSVYSFLHDDGRATLAHDAGTAASRGSRPEAFGDPLDGSAEMVHFGANYVFCERTISDDFAVMCSGLLRPCNCGGVVCERCRMAPAEWIVDREHGGFYSVCSPRCGGWLAAVGRDDDDVLAHAAELVDGLTP